MKKILVVLACYGFVVSPAMGGERWSPETCKHLQEIRDAVVGGPKTGANEYQKALMLIPIRANIYAKCGGTNQADIDAGQAVIKAGDPFYKKLTAYYQRLLAMRDLSTGCYQVSR
jgi:hypothetical protein